MTYEELDQVNKELKTIPLKGKEYTEVKERVKAFRKLMPNGSIETNIEKLEDGIVIMSCTIKDETGRILSKSYAYEKENSSNVNKTSFIENCDTSATGRALGYLGIGIKDGIASAEEVTNAIERQAEENPDVKIGPTYIKTLEATKKKYKMSQENYDQILKEYGYEKTEDIKMKDFMAIGNKISGEKK